MNYTELLNKLIKESNLSNKEIVKRCEEMGTKITPNYLSLLKNDEDRTASDEVSRVLARICGAKSDEILVVQAYLDKAPDIILNILNGLIAGSLNMVKALLEQNKEALGEARYNKEIEELEKLSQAEVICYYMQDGIEIPEIDPSMVMANLETTKWAVVPLDKGILLTDEQVEKLRLNE